MIVLNSRNQKGNMAFKKILLNKQPYIIFASNTNHKSIGMNLLAIDGTMQKINNDRSAKFHGRHKFMKL